MAIIQLSCYVKTSEVLKKCFEELILNKIDLTGVILKPNMILDGVNAKKKLIVNKLLN